MNSAGTLGTIGGVLMCVNPALGALVLTAAACTWIVIDTKPPEEPKPQAAEPKISEPFPDFFRPRIPPIGKISPLQPFDLSSFLMHHDGDVSREIADQWLAQPGPASHLDVEITHEWIRNGEIIKTTTSRNSFSR